MIVEEEIGRRDLLKGGASVFGYLTLKNVLLGLGVAALGAEYVVNTRRTLDNLQHLLQPDPPYDAVVVLGAGNSIEKGEEVPSIDGQLRVIAGVEEYMRGSAKLLRFAGGARSGTPEAKVMAKFAGEYALLPIKGISGETESVDTLTNLLQIREWKKQNPGVKKIGVSTNAYHMRGVQVLGENLGLHLYPVVAEQILVDTGKPELIKKVRDYYADPSFPSRIDKEQARLAMLLIDPESRISHERADWQKRVPLLRPAFDLVYKALEIAGQKLVPLEVKPVI